MGTYLDIANTSWTKSPSPKMRRHRGQVFILDRFICFSNLTIFFFSFLSVSIFEDSFALISTWSYMIEGTGECYSQSASLARSFIKDLLSPSAEDGLDPYTLLGDICQEWRLDPYAFQWHEAFVILGTHFSLYIFGKISANPSLSPFD